MFTTMKEGDSGPLVKQLQIKLEVCRTPAPPAPPVPIPYPAIKADGKFGSKTKLGVLSLQKMAKLKPTGEVDAQTMKHIVNVYRTSKGGSKKSPGKSKLNQKQQANVAAMRGQTTHLKALQKWVAQTQKAVDAWGKAAALQDRQVGKSRDDAQLAQINLQHSLQKQQQSLQVASMTSKRLHDTAMAVIKKIG